MKLVIAATPDVAFPTIDSLIKSEHEVLRIISQPDRPAGRGQKLTATAVGNKYKCEKPSTEEEFAKLLKDADLLITIGYGRLLLESTLAIPRFGAINLHFSLLPKWRGAAPVQRSLEAGDKLTGVTVFQMDKGMDTGPIWAQKSFNIPESFYASDLFSALATLGVEVIAETLLVIGEETPRPQVGAATIAKKITSDELLINWNRKANEIRNQIRGLGPATYSIFREEKLRISKVELSNLELGVGQLNVRDKKVFVGTGDAALELARVTPSGKREMTGFEFANGARIKIGDKFA